MEMEQEQARALFEKAAVLIFTDVPFGTEFGIDNNSWNVGEKFRGVKMIPPGVHFVYYSSTDAKHKDVAPRCGFFHDFKKSEVLVKKWDPRIEDISESPVPEEEVERFRSNLRELDRFLGPYPYENLKKWVSLSDHVTESTIRRLQPNNCKIASAPLLVPDEENRTTAERADSQRRSQGLSPEERLPKMHAMPGTEIKFSRIPEKSYPEGASPTQVTKYSMDLSYSLETLLGSTYADDDQGILGELQFAFICFLVGQVYEAFEQWKALVHLLCASEESITRHTELYSEFIRVVYFQLAEVPPDFFVDIVSRDNFLVSSLRLFFANLNDSAAASTTLKSRALKFQSNLTKRFKWDFTMEPEDEAPVVVDAAGFSLSS